MIRLAIVMMLAGMFSVHAAYRNGETITPRDVCVMDRDTVRGRREVYRLVGFGAPEIGATARSSRRVRLPTL